MEHIKDQLSWQEFYSGSKNVKIIDMSTQDGNLEDVFVNLTND